MLPVRYCSYKIDEVRADGAIPHTHTVSSEIIQTFENHGSILINGKLYNMKKNGLYFIYGMTVHFVAPDDINRYNHSIVILETREVESMFKNLSMTEEFHKIFTENGGAFCELPPETVIEADKLFLEMSKALEDGEEMQYARIASALIGLMRIGIKYMENKETSNGKISDIISFVSDNALKKITIDDICESVHMSKYHLCRVFKENVGVTIWEFIKNRRLSVAKQMLVDNDSKISEIAQKCGFSDSSFFTKTFSKEFGVTPSEFRAKYR